MIYTNAGIQLGVPYFEAISDSTFAHRKANGPDVWSQWYFDTDSRDYYQLQNVTAGDAVVNSNGQNLTGTVYLVEKFMDAYQDYPVNDPSDQYSILGGRSTDYNSIFSQSTCGVWDKNFAMNKYNDTTNHQYTSLPTYIDGNDTLYMNLDCNPSFQLNVPDGIIDHEIEANYPTFGYWVECDGIMYNPNFNFIDLADIIHNFNSSDCLDGITVGAGGDGAGDGTGPDVTSVQVFNLSEKGDPPVEIDLSHVFTDNHSPYIAPDYGFSSGLYKVFFVHEDGFAFPIVVEHDADEYESVSNSDFADLTIAPNPISTDYLSFKIEVEKSMRFEIKVLALDGTVLKSETRELREDTEINRSIKVPEQDYPYQQIVVKVIFEDGSSLEEIALRPQQ